MTVEAALLFPIVMMLTFGVIEYGWMFLKHQQVTNAARQAARLAATVDATNGQVTSQVTSMMSTYGLGSSGYTTTIAAGTNNNVSQPRGTLVSVTVSVPYGNIDITGFTLLPLPSTISAKVTMEKEGP
jgi:Flp pilus assembly protein TadG